MKHSDRPGPEETHIMRANGYRLLADAYQRPELLREGILHQLATTVGALYSQCEAPARALLDALGGMNDQTEALRVAHAKLFIGPRELLAPPYGSVYLDQEALVMGASTIDAAACYEKAGLSPEEQFLEPPDHVVTELEFMYFLAHRQVVTGEPGYLEDQRDFLAGHLGLWITPFTAAIARAALHPYYTALARLTKAFVRADAAALDTPRESVAAVG